jgi:hypothetical protein
VARRRGGEPKERMRPAPVFVHGDVVRPEADPPIRAGPVRWHRGPTAPRTDRTNG